MDENRTNSPPGDSDDDIIEPLFKDGTKFKKKTRVRKFVDAFIRGDKEEVGEYVFEYYIVPGLQKTVSTAVNAALSMMFGLDKKKSSKRSAVDRISYRAYYDDDRDYEPRRYSDSNRDRERSVERRRSVYECDDIERGSRDEIEKILMAMDDIIYRKHRISVFTLYQLLGRKTEYTDRNYGWYSTKGAQVIRTSDGWLLRLPKVVPFD